MFLLERRDMDLKLNYPLLAKLVAAEMRGSPVAREWMSPAQTATYTGIPAKTLEQYRRDSSGPSFSRVGKHVRYNRRDVDEWLRSLQDERAGTIAND